MSKRNIFTIDFEWLDDVVGLSPRRGHYERSQLNCAFENIVTFVKNSDVRPIVFFTGMVAREFPEYVTTLHQMGCIIGNHTYHHIDITDVSYSKLSYEIKSTQNVLEEILGRNQSKMFRSPRFSKRKDLKEYFALLRALGITYDFSFCVGEHRGGASSSNENINHIKELAHSYGVTVMPMYGISIYGQHFFPGGGSFRILPMRQFEKFFVNENVYYFHPREFLKRNWLRNTTNTKQIILNRVFTGSPKEKFQHLVENVNFLNLELN